MNFAGDNPAVNSLLSVDSDLLVGNYMSKSILPGISHSQDTSILDDLSISLQAGLYGMANNAIQIGNYFGGDFETYDVAEELGVLGAAYEESKASYDLAGDIITSLIPGTFAFKALKAAKLAKNGNTISRALGFLDGKSTSALQEAAGIMRNAPNFHKVTELKRKAFLYSTLDELATGVIVGASIEASQHLGTIMMDESLTFTDKLARFATPVAVGGVIGAPFGAFSYFANARKLLKPAQDAYNGVLGDLAYASVFTKGNKITNKEHVSNHILDEIDRISGYSPLDTENKALVTFAQDEFVERATNEYKRYVSEIVADSPLSKTHTSEEKLVIKSLQEIVDKNIGSVEGRGLIRNLMDKTIKADHNSTHVADSLYTKLNKVKHRDVSVIYDNPTTNSGAGISFKGQDYKMIPLTSQVKDKASRLEIGDKPLSAMALNTDHPNVLNNLDKYKIFNRVIGLTDKTTKLVGSELNIAGQLDNTVAFLKANDIDVFDEADLFSKLSETKRIIEDGNYSVPKQLDKTKFVDTMQALFKRMDDNKVSDYLLTDTANKWVDINTAAIKVKPTRNLFGKNLAAIKKPEIIRADTNLLGVQKLRLQAGKHAAEKKAAFFDKLSDFSGTAEEELQAWVQLEALAIKAVETNAGAIKLAGDESISLKKAYELIKTYKRSAAEMLLKNHNADEVMHTLGIDDLPTLLSREVTPTLITPEVFGKIMKPASELTELKEIRLTLKTNSLTPEQTLLKAAEDSGRLDQIAKGKAIASEVAGKNLDEVLPKMPDLGGVEEISNTGRLIFDSHLKGTIKGINAVSVFIGDQQIALAERLLLKAKKETRIDELHNALINNPKSAGELLAFTHWYRTQGAKYGIASTNDGIIMVERKLLDKYETLKKDLVDVPQDIPSIKEWLASPEVAGLKHETYEVTDKLAVDTIKATQVLDRKHINYAKNLIDGAYDNAINAPENVVYMPPRNLPYSRYFRVENGGDPLAKTSSTLYKVHSKSKQGLALQVQKAKDAFAKEGIKAQLISGDDAATQKALALEFNWDGLELNLGKAVTTTERSGAHPDFSLGTIQEYIEDTASWLDNGTKNISTGAIELHYMDELSKIRSLQSVENRYKINGDDSIQGKEINARNLNTWDTIHKQMIGRDAPFSVYNKVNNFVADTMASVLEPVHQARIKLRDALSKSGQITRDDIMEADKIGKAALKARGVDDVMGNAIDSYLQKETSLTGKNIQEAVAGTQYVMSTLLLRLDGIDPLMNILGMTTKLSSEMKYIQDVVKTDPINRAKVDDVYTKWFGTGSFKNGQEIDISLLSPYKAVATGMKDMFSNKGAVKEFLNELEVLGIYKNDIKVMSELIDDLPVPQNISDAASEARFLGKTRDNVKKATEWATKPHKASITLTQYTALKFASDIADAAGIDLATKRLLMSGMNHRVNAISSHVSKPRLFQGLVGNAVSLYQSYFSHTIGNMIRHAQTVGSGPVIRGIAMNSSFFGLQSAPAFDMINKQIAAQQDANNADLYSTAYDVLPTWAADTIMFGIGSSILGGNLSSRGDITPRYATVFPTSVEQLAITQAVINTVGSVIDNTHKLVTGEQGISQWAANTIIDSKLSRPLSGIVSIATGRTVDNRHSLVSLHDDLFSWGNAVRLAGAKPLDEARVNQAFWNLQSYRTRDEQRKANLANIMKSEFQANPQVMDDPEWINNKYNKYINAGGNTRNFERFYTNTVLKASTTFEQRLQRSVRDLDVARNYKHLLGVE